MIFFSVFDTLLKFGLLSNGKRKCEGNHSNCWWICLGPWYSNVVLQNLYLFFIGLHLFWCLNRTWDDLENTVRQWNGGIMQIVKFCHHLTLCFISSKIGIGCYVFFGTLTGWLMLDFTMLLLQWWWCLFIISSIKKLRWVLWNECRKWYKLKRGNTSVCQSVSQWVPPPFTSHYLIEPSRVCMHVVQMEHVWM